MGYILKDLEGQKFERLQVIEFAGVDKRGHGLWKVLCDCGNEKIIPGYGLTRKKCPYRSCGCWTKERVSKMGKVMWQQNKLGISKSATLFLDKLETLVNKPIEREFHLSWYYYDGRIDNVLIEIDGAYWHRTAQEHKRDQQKTLCALQHGFTIYRFNVRRIHEVPEALQKYASTIEEIKQCLS